MDINNDTDIWHLHLLQQDQLDMGRGTATCKLDQVFLAATSIIDMGCGYGDYLASLAREYPKKRFLGVDFDEAALEHARSRHRLKNIDFIKADIENDNLFQVLGKHDYMIARLLLQHLSSIEKFADAAAKLLNSGGGLLVVDVHEPSKRFLPDMPDYRQIFKCFRDYQNEKRKGEEVFNLPLLLKKQNFIIQGEVILLQNTDNGLDKVTLHKVLETNLTVLEGVYNIPGNYTAARMQLQHWLATSSSYASMGDYQLSARKL